MNDLIYWIWLSLKCGYDTPTFTKLYAHFESVEDIFNSTQEQLEQIDGLTKKQIDLLLNKETENAYSVLNKCKRMNFGILPFNDELYPSRLRTIKNPPVVLYYAGRLPEIDNEVCIATVGTRTPTPYGCRCAYEISYDLAVCGAVIVSGMAFGIDSICHRAALDAGGKTIAVFGCGLDIIYPKENNDLYKNLLAQGTVISEYAPGTKPTSYSFPQRNRIISGMSLGTLLVESKLKSGAMITASKTLEQGRDLFAIPGRVGEYNSMGPNSLIQNGAKSVSEAKDILKEYQFLYPEKVHVSKSNKKINFSSEFDSKQKIRSAAPISIIQKDKREYDEAENALTRVHTEQISPIQKNFDHLPEEQKSICNTLCLRGQMTSEEVALKTGLNISDTMSALTILEIQGIIRALPGGLYEIQ